MLHEAQAWYKNEGPVRGAADGNRSFEVNRARAAMTEHTKTDGLPGLDSAPLAPVLERSRPRNDRMAAEKIECNACPVLCQISPGKAGACDRYANEGGALVRVDPVVLLRRTLTADAG